MNTSPSSNPRKPTLLGNPAIPSPRPQRHGLPTTLVALAALLCFAQIALAQNATNFHTVPVQGGVKITGYNGTSAPNFTIPSKINGLTVREIAENAFNSEGADPKTRGWSATGTKPLYITIPNTVTKIGADAFSNQDNVSSLNIPAGVVDIANGAFSNMQNLTRITVDPINPNYFSPSNPAEPQLLYNKARTRIEAYPSGRPGEYIIPQSVREIAPRAFESSRNLTFLSIPNSVQTIGKRAFYNAFSLFEVRIGTGVTYIGDEAFADPVSALVSVVFFGDAPALGTNVFRNTPGNFLVRYLPGKAGFPAGSSQVNYDMGNGNFVDVKAFEYADDFFFDIANGQVSIMGYAGNDIRMESFIDTLPTPTLSVADTAARDALPRTIPDGFIVRVVQGNPAMGEQDNLIYKKTGVNSLLDINIWELVNNADIRFSFPNVPVGQVLKVQDGSRIIYYQKIGADSADPDNWIEVDFRIPSTLVNLPVTSIGVNAFRSNTFLRSVVLPTSITKIGANAFNGCTNLGNFPGPLTPNQGIFLPASVNGIEDGAFANLTSAKGIVVSPENASFASQNGVVFNKNIGRLVVFPAGKPVNSYTIPDSVTEIGERAFEGALYVSQVNMPSRLAAIRANAFLNVWSMPQVILPSTVTTVGDNAFASMVALTQAIFEGNAPANFGANVFAGTSPTFTVRYFEGAAGFTTPTWTPNAGQTYNSAPLTQSGDFIFQISGSQATITGYTGAGGSVTIPDTIRGVAVREIGDAAFLNQSGITSIEFPRALSKIGARAFEGTGLTTVNIPAGVTSIGSDAFVNTRNMERIRVEPDNPVYSSDGTALFNKTRTTLIAFPANGPSSYSMPTTVNEIGPRAFAYNRNLRAIEIPNSVTTIRTEAFIATERLTDVRFGLNVNTIEARAFADPLGALSTVTFYGNSPTTVGADIFRNHPQVFVVRYLAGKAGFPSGASGTWQGYYAESLTNLDGFEFEVVNSTVRIKGYSGSFPRIYESWNSLPDTQQAVFFRADLDNPAIVPTSVAVGYLVYVIEQELIWRKSGQTEIDNGQGVPKTIINNWEVFSNSGARLDSNIPIGDLINEQDGRLRWYQRVGEDASSISSWNEVDFQIPETLAGLPVTSIAPGAFANNPDIRSVVLPNSITEIGANAFYNCRNFGWFTSRVPSQGVFIPASVITIGDGAFANLPGMLGISVAEANPNYTSVNFVLFNKNRTRLIQYPSGKAGTTYEVPRFVTEIGPRAFEGASNLQSVSLPDTVTTISPFAFRSAASLLQVVFSPSVSSIGDGAFAAIPTLRTAVFLGNAPLMGSGVFDGASAQFSVRYNTSAVGFTTPTWFGYPSNPIASWTAGINQTTSGFRALGFVEATALNDYLGGSISIAVNRSGVLTGTITMPEGPGLVVTYRFGGNFNDDGIMEARIDRRGRTPLTLTLVLDLAQAPDNFVLAAGSKVSDGTNEAALSAASIPWSAQVPATDYAGLYNVGFDTDPDDLALMNGNRPVVSQGHGFAALSIVERTGAVRVAGTLSDNSRLTASTFVLGDGSVPLWVPLYNRLGALTGDMEIDASATGRPVAAELYWTKPANQTRLPDATGFQNVQLTASPGSGLYTQPALPPSTITLLFNQGKWSLNPQGLVGGNFSQEFTVKGRITPTSPNPNGVRATWNLRSGKLQGTFTNGGRTARFQAAILTGGAPGTFQIRGNYIMPNVPSKPAFLEGGGVSN